MLDVKRPEVFEEIFHEYYASLCYFANKFVQDEDAAKDIVQEVFVHFWESKGRFENRVALKSFLYTSVKNEIISLYRKGKAQERYSSQLENEAFFANTVIDQETQLLLFNAIHSLPDRERQIFELSFIEGLKNIEIAEQLGVSDSTVKKAKAKVLEILREKLDPRLFLFFFLG